MPGVARACFALSVCSSLSLLAFSQATPAPVIEPEVIYGTTSVEWPASIPDAGLLLTVSGPAGLYLRQENPAGAWGRFSLVDQQGQMRPDGIYKWELMVQAGWEAVVESGWFEIRGGRVVAEGTGETQPVVVEESAPARSLYVDSQGRLGVGTSVPESQLHVKGSSPAFALEDTTTGGGLFTWRGLEKGDGSLGLFDKTGQARWLVDSEDSGKPAVGLIAEEVDEVVPEVVAHEGGEAKGVNYANLVAVLVEAVKEQQRTIQDQHKVNEEQRAAFHRELDSLKAQVETLKALLAR